MDDNLEAKYAGYQLGWVSYCFPIEKAGRQDFSGYDS